MKKILFAFLFFALTGVGMTMAQSNLGPVEGPLQPGQGQANQAEFFQATVTEIGGEAYVVNSIGETFFLRNGHGLLQSNQIQIGDIIWVTHAQDFNTSRSNKERG